MFWKLTSLPSTFGGIVAQHRAGLDPNLKPLGLVQWRIEHTLAHEGLPAAVEADIARNVGPAMHAEEVNAA